MRERAGERVELSHRARSSTDVVEVRLMSTDGTSNEDISLVRLELWVR